MEDDEDGDLDLEVVDQRTLTNWKLCCFCQQKKHVKLISPSDKSGDEGKKLYSSIEKDIKNCIANDYTLPFHMTVKCLIAEGYGNISSSLFGKTAIYHKTCRDLIGQKIVNLYMKSKETSNILQIELRDITEWELCCFCQSENNKEALVQPHLKQCYHKSYTKIQTDIRNCCDNGFTLPFNMTEKCLITANYSDVSTSLLGNKAIFHKKCRDEIGPSRVERFLQAKAKRIAEEDNEDTSSISPKKTRRSFESSCSRTRLQCVYCLIYDDDPENNEHICKAGSVSDKLKDMAKTAQNWAVYTRLNTAFDNTASDISYHKTCYTKLANEARSAEISLKSKNEEESVSFDPLVIAELVAYIKHKDCEMKLVDLKALYEQRLNQVNSKWVGRNVHATRLKDHLLEKLGDSWQSFKPENGKNVILSRKDNAAKVLLEHMNDDSEDEAQKIVEVGLLLRKHILVSQAPFSGTFSPNCLSEPVPNSLLTLLRVLLEGAGGIGVEKNSEITARMRVALTLSQLVISNSVQESSNAQQLYQVRSRETPFPLYTALVLNCNGHQKKVIKKISIKLEYVYPMIEH